MSVLTDVVAWAPSDEGDAVPQPAPAQEPIAPVTLIAGLAVEELERRLQLASRATDVGHRTLAFYLADMDGRRLYQATGHSSAVDYAVRRLSMSRREARDLVATGRALLVLRRIDVEFAEGRLSWSKVRLLARVAVPATEAAWIERAAAVSCRQLEHQVETTRLGQGPREDHNGLPEVRFQVSAWLDAVTHELWQQARRKWMDETGEPVGDAELMGGLAKMLLSTAPAAPAPRGRRAVDGSLYRVVVRRCPDCAKDHVSTMEGDVAIPKQEAASIGCDAGAMTVDSGSGKHGRDEPTDTRDRPTPDRLRRRVLARDGLRCTSCRSQHGLMVHHVVFREHGGPTREENLITLCGRCHAMAHDGLLQIEGSVAGGLRFTDRGGRDLSGAADPAQPALKLRIDAARDGARAPRPFRLDDIPDEVDLKWWREHQHLFEWVGSGRKARVRLKKEAPIERR